MSRIPRKAQRAIDAANRRRAAAGEVPAQASALPKRLDVGTMNGAYCRLFDVYLNGVKQTTLKVADVDGGYVDRYTNVIFDPRYKCMRAQPPYETVREFGTVEIRRKAR